jgi:signal transduction histidine kinase
MPDQTVFERYQDLQAYVGWTAADADRVSALAHLVESSFVPFVEDFYQEIDRHPDARKVITGGAEQIARLKGTLVIWLKELFAGNYDAAYVRRRSNVGLRHVEIGLEQIYTNAALSRLRKGLLRTISEAWTGTAADLAAAVDSLNRLLDLDLAIIEDAYQTEYERRRRQTDRLATIGQVAGGIAHELRNPLNVIKTSVYYLLNARQSTPEKRAEHLQRIDRQVSTADGVITALNDFARLPIPSLERMSIEGCLRDVLENTPLPKTVEVHIDVPPAVPNLLGDAEQLKIVLGNLVRNARDAMPSGGRLTLSANKIDGDQVEIRVIDTGVGIKPEDLERVMEPLYSTKARGIGLGLAITRAIVEKHQGRLRVTSELGRGTEFVVTLPSAQGSKTDE